MNNTIATTNASTTTDSALADVLAQVQRTSERWIASFNNGDLEACVNAYAVDAVMDVHPKGSFVGHQQIRAFWHSVIGSGAGVLRYQNVTLRVVDAHTVLLSADWTMNVGGGSIFMEKWVRQADGRWLLERDAFEIKHWTAAPSSDSEAGHAV